MVPVPPRFTVMATALLWSFISAVPAQAGVNKPYVIVDSTIVYLGIVPAALTRDYSAERMGDAAMGGKAVNSIHNIHLLVALFDHGTGERLISAHVSARFLGERGRKWSVMLKPMIVNGSMTYGAYSSMGADENASVFIDVVRPFGSRTQSLSARFEYSHD